MWTYTFRPWVKNAYGIPLYLSDRALSFDVPDSVTRETLDILTFWTGTGSAGPFGLERILAGDLKGFTTVKNAEGKDCINLGQFAPEGSVSYISTSNRMMLQLLTALGKTEPDGALKIPVTDVVFTDDTEDR